MALLVGGGIATATTLAVVGSEEPEAAPARTTTTAAAPTSFESAASRNGYDTPVAVLPAAPPIELWVEGGSDFQQTLDMNLQAAMISHLRMWPADADVTAARELAYYVCGGLREGRQTSPATMVSFAYPLVDTASTVPVGFAAQSYCRDTYPW